MKRYGVPTATSRATQGRSAGNYMENPQAGNGGRKEVLKKEGGKGKHTLLMDKVKNLFS